MTILNAWVEPERALIGLDTQYAAQGGSAQHISKLMPLVHMSAALGCSGSAFFMQTLFMLCQVSGSEFDELVDALPQLLKYSSERITEVAERLGVAATMPLDGQSVVIVGWSARAGRMIGRNFEQESRAEAFIAEDLNPYYNAPWDQSLARLPESKTPGDMAQLARAQTALLREKAPDAQSGGRFIVAELRRDGMTIAKVCDL